MVNIRYFEKFISIDQISINTHSIIDTKNSISILIPIGPLSYWLDTAIKSVKQQTVDCLHICFIQDGTNCSKLFNENTIQRYFVQRHHNKINLGAYGARNHGLK